MKLSEKIVYLRKEQGWSQEQLAIKLDVSRQAVYKWEADINQPDLEKLKKISSLFNVSFNNLMDDNIDISNPNSIVQIEMKDEENEEIPEVEVLENTFNEGMSPKTVHNEVAVQINYGKEMIKKSNKKLIVSLCVLAAVIVLCLCTLSYILFGIVLQKDSYLVKFDTQGGTSLTDLVIKEGKKIETLSAPSKDGYTFDGWYVGDKKWDFNLDKIKGNTTLTAKWIPNENIITYVDYETGERFESKGKTDETIVLASNTFIKKGYVFSGWALSPNGEVVYTNCTTIKMGAENITLYAVWQVGEYSLTLNPGNGKINDTYPEKFTSNDKVTLPIPTLNNYTFDGWYDENGKKYDSIPKGTVGDITLYAKYSPMAFNIHYVLNGGVNDENNPKSYFIGDDVILFDPTKENTAFDGWYLDADFIEIADETVIAKTGGHITLYAKWIDEKFEFAEVSGGVALIGYEGSSQKVVIPKEYLYYDVVEISSGAFYGCEYMCEVVIPSTVRKIDPLAFDECLLLETITVDKGNTTYSSIDGVLFNKSGTWLYKYPTGREDTVYIAPSSVDVIGPYAFAFAIFLEEVYLPNDSTLTYGIGKVCESAFDGCISLVKIELGYIANYFEPRCFRNCWSLESITFKADTVWGIAESAFENCMSLSEVVFNCVSVKDISNYAFKGCLSLNTLDLTVVEKLGSNVFYESGLMELYIPSTVTYIGNQIFCNCIYDTLIVYCEFPTKPLEWANNWSYGAAQVIWNTENGDSGDIEEVEPTFTYGTSTQGATIVGVNGKGVIYLPGYDNNGNKITRIEAGAFAGQNEITEVIIPVTITSIDPQAFDECIGLEKITYLGTYTEFRSQDGVLFGDYGRSIVKYPEGKKDLSYVVPTDVDIIRKYAFKNNTYLKVITLPGDVIGDNYVGKLEQGAFLGCTALETVNGCYVSYFDKEAFKGCTSLKELTVHSEEVSFLMNEVFEYCTSLEKITFKGNVGATGWRVFGFCSMLKNVEFEGTLEKIGWGCFEECISLETITVPEGVTVIGGEAFMGCYNLSVVNIPMSLSTIEEYAFSGTSVQYFNIPSYITTLGDYVFANTNGTFLFCEATSKPDGWSDKWNFATNEEDSEEHKTYWGEFYQEPTFEYSRYGSNDKVRIDEVKNIKNDVLILPNYLDGKKVVKYGTSVYSETVKTLFIPYWLDEIDISAFYSLEEIIVHKQNELFSSKDGVVYSKDETELLKYPRNKKGEYVVTIGLEKIGGNAFLWCDGLTSIRLYNDTEDYGVSVIDTAAFNGCKNLESVYFGKYITKIGDSAFANCTSLKNVEFTNINTLTLENFAFYKCNSLESVTFKGASTIIKEQVFNLCENLKEIDLHNVISIGASAIYAKNIKEVFIPNTVIQMGNNAFCQCTVTKFYCQHLEKPSTWSEYWIARTEFIQVLWGQNELPNEE